MLRFFAFLSVFIVHTVSYSPDFLVQRHVPSWAARMCVGFGHAGAYGVDVFFVLSAYLITELLLREKDATGSMGVRAFYARRILRIWPLYYLFVPLAALVPFLNPHHEFGLRYVLPFLFFIGNWSFVFLGWPTSVASPLWSVSVEEQFYLLWPPIVSRLSRRQINIAAILMIAAANISRLWAVGMHQSTAQLWGNTLAHLDSIAAGILLANLLRGGRLSVSLRGRVALITLAVFGLTARGCFVEISPSERLTWLGTAIGYPAVVLACTAILIAFMGFRFRSPILEYLGKISYGLYVYHLMSIAIADHLLHHFVTGGPVHAIGRIMVALWTTIAISSVSYAVVEKQFLKLKRRFTYVPSRPA